MMVQVSGPLYSLRAALCIVFGVIIRKVRISVLNVFFTEKGVLGAAFALKNAIAMH
jgi:hypothetical protein